MSNVRERILDAALRVLSRDGAKSLAQPTVAREAGMPQGHLTYYFPKKIDLVRGVAEHLRNTIMQELGPMLAKLPSGRALRKSVLALAAKVAQNRGRTRILLGLLVEMENDPALRNELAERVQALRALFATVMERDPTDIDVDLALATAWGLGLQHLILEGRRTNEETERLFARLGDWLEAERPPVRTKTKPPPSD